MVHVGANKFGIDVHTRMLLKLHFSHFSCNMFVGQWAHIVYLSIFRFCFSVLLDPLGSYTFLAGR